MNAITTTSTTNRQNGHCFWIDNDGATDLDDLPILGDQFKANLGAEFHCTGANPSYLVYVGF